MTNRSPYPDEVRDRAVRLVLATQDQHDSQWAAMRSVADKIVCSSETVHNLVRQTETDNGKRPGVTSGHLEELRQLKRESAELRRTNDILKSASAFYAAET